MKTQRGSAIAPTPPARNVSDVAVVENWFDELKRLVPNRAVRVVIPRAA